MLFLLPKDASLRPSIGARRVSQQVIVALVYHHHILGSLVLGLLLPLVFALVEACLKAFEIVEVHYGQKYKIKLRIRYPVSVS